ncbi:ww domain binding protein 11 [Stemphylium lycopersici]|nr:ww domain binding protein 11 [Stemphylium lycopersici]
MAKEKNYNPVQEAKKAEKQKQIRKQKANLQTQRNEKLARRNPNRIQRDIDNLKELDQSGSLRPHERQRLQELEKDLAAVNKARAALGDKAPVFKPERRFDNDDRGRGHGEGRGGGVLGKRTRNGQRKEDDSSDTDDDVKHIPMPRDTPPPIPRKYQARDTQADEAAPEAKKATIVYEAAPQVRDLRKEATRFMPASVAQKVKLAKGEGRLLEPEEFDRLREEGYMNEQKKAEAQASGSAAPEQDEELEAFLRLQNADAGMMAEMAAEAAVQEAEYDMMAAEAKGEMQGISGEARTAENTLKHVQMEEVEDEDL